MYERTPWGDPSIFVVSPPIQGPGLFAPEAIALCEEAELGTSLGETAVGQAPQVT